MSMATYLLVLVNLVSLKINDTYAKGQLSTTVANTTYYIEFEQKFTWFDAQIQCSKMNMNLVDIQTETKFMELYTLLNSFKIPYFLKRSLWTGGIRTLNPTNGFAWLSTGEAFTYTNWSEKNPDFTGFNEFCVELIKARNWKWNDMICKIKNGFLCEYKKETKIQQELNKLKQEKDKHLQEKLDLQRQHQLQLQVLEKNHRKLENQIKFKTRTHNNIQQHLENKLLELTKNVKELENKMKEHLKENSVDEVQEKHQSVYEMSRLGDYMNELCRKRL